MDARVFDKGKLPSRSVTEGPSRGDGSVAIWTDAQTAGPAFDGAVIRPGFAGETHVHADL